MIPEAQQTALRARPEAPRARPTALQARKAPKAREAREAIPLVPSARGAALRDRARMRQVYRGQA